MNSQEQNKLVEQVKNGVELSKEQKIRLKFDSAARAKICESLGLSNSMEEIYRAIAHNRIAL